MTLSLVSLASFLALPNGIANILRLLNDATLFIGYPSLFIPSHFLASALSSIIFWCFSPLLNSNILPNGSILVGSSAISGATFSNRIMGQAHCTPLRTLTPRFFRHLAHPRSLAPRLLSVLSSSKRSARIRSKKLKSLRIAEQNLREDDLFFINSLTASDIAKLGHKCGFIFLQNNATIHIEKNEDSRVAPLHETQGVCFANLCYLIQKPSVILFCYQLII